MYLVGGADGMAIEGRDEAGFAHRCVSQENYFCLLYHGEIEYNVISIYFEFSNTATTGRRHTSKIG